MDHRADPVYGDPQSFFENTYPTAGLKTLLKDALGRLTRNAGGKNAVIRLETAFGGGKTHNLIALYHVASGNTPAGQIADLLGGAIRLPERGEIKIAGVVGSDLDPTVGIRHATDGTKTLTLWGELAYRVHPHHAGGQHFSNGSLGHFRNASPGFEPLCPGPPGPLPNDFLVGRILFDLDLKPSQRQRRLGFSHHLLEEIGHISEKGFQVPFGGVFDRSGLA